VVTRGWFSSLIERTTSTPVPFNLTSVTLPTSTPATLTIAPLFRPWTLSNDVFRVYRCQAKPLAPPTATMSSAVRVSAMTATTPIFSSDHASDRVRGIFLSYDRNECM
jgi:hypothetical protein